MGYLGSLKVDGAESFHAWGVNDGAPAREVKQFAERSRVHSLVMGVAHITHLDMGVGYQQIDDG